MLEIVFLFLLPLINCNVEVRQDFVTTDRLFLRYEIITNSPDNSRPRTTNFSLFPRSSKTQTIHLKSFDTAFNYSIQLLEPFTKQQMGAPIHRQIQFLDTTQPWLNDSFTTASGVTLTVATKISCSPNYFGSRCEAFCNGNLAKTARKRCDAMGRLRCDIGWMGPHCGQAVDPRKCSCQNDGICASTLIHSSENSTINAADNNELLVCECVNGFTGDRCQVPSFSQFRLDVPKADVCKVKDVCLNGAQCFSNGPKVFCSCVAGFIGEFCEVSMSATTPTIEIKPTTSDYYGIVFSVVGIILLIGLLLMCIRYKKKHRRENALTRGQAPEPYAMPSNKSMLVDSEACDMHLKKVFTVENRLTKIDEEERYTSAPRNIQQNEYAVIQKTLPPPPTSSPPSVPVTCVYV